MTSPSDSRPRTWQAWLQESPPGMRHALLRAGLWLLQGPYAIVTGVRNAAFDRGWRKVRIVDRPVVSVGNLTVGGTGKTPLVLWLAEWFRAQDVRTAVLSRGYGATHADGRNDEALQLERRLPDVPHLENPDRAAAAELAIHELEMQLLLLDDGFQHRKLHRDLDVVLVDALNPLGGGWLLPRGLLREGFSSLRRAHAVVLSRADLVPQAERERIRRLVLDRNPALVWAEARHRPRRLIASGDGSAELASLADKRIAAFCGIGNPEGFRRTLAELGWNVVAFRPFPDHHAYTREELLSDLPSWGDSCQAEAFVCTEKDLVKIDLDALGGRPLWAVEIGLEFLSGEAEFVQLLDPLASRAAALEAHYDEVWPTPPSAEGEAAE